MKMIMKIIKTLTKTKKFLFLFSLMNLISFSLSTLTNLELKLNNKVKTLSKNTLTHDSEEKKEHTLSITGTAIKEIEPNLIKVGIKIETLDKILKKSYDENSKVSNLVTKVFANKKIEKDNISTTNYEIKPIYEKKYFADTNKHTNIFMGYRVINEMEVSLEKKLIAQELIDDTVLQGPVFITYVKFVYTEDLIKKTKDSLLSEASVNALNLSKKIANVLTMKVDDVKNVNIDDFVYPRSNVLNYNYDSRYIKKSNGNDNGNGAFKMPPPTFYAGADYVKMNVKAVFVIMKK